MRQIPSLRPRLTRPPLREHAPSFFQMHVYDQELHRLEAEQAEISKRISVIEERVQVIQKELLKLDRTLRSRVYGRRDNH